MKKPRVANRKLVTGSWRLLILHGRTNCSTKTSLGTEASINGFPHSKN